jgi:hypothetical protein
MPIGEAGARTLSAGASAASRRMGLGNRSRGAGSVLRACGRGGAKGREEVEAGEPSSPARRSRRPMDRSHDVAAVARSDGEQIGSGMRQSALVKRSRRRSGREGNCVEGSATGRATAADGDEAAFAVQVNARAFIRLASYPADAGGTSMIILSSSVVSAARGSPWVAATRTSGGSRGMPYARKSPSCTSRSAA